jgi:phage major head subunit gpT-like protein
VILSPTNIERFFSSLNTAYNLQYNEVATFFEQFATTYPCASTTWLTAYLTQIDNARIWKGSRHVRTPAPMTYQVTPLPWELTVEIDTFLLQDDQFGIYSMQAQQIGEKMRKIPDQAIRDLLEGYGDFAGAAQTSLDEVTHWNASHPVDFWDAGKGTFCNDFGTAGVSVNGITVGGTFSAPAYSTVWEEMSTRKDESGEVDGVIADLLMVPPQLHFSAKQITQGQLFGGPTLGAFTGQVGAVDNPYKGSTDLLMNPYLARQPATWYMMQAKGVVKPIAWILHTPAQTVMRNAPNDPIVFDRHAMQWGAWSRAVPAWGPPRMSSRSGVV